MNLYLRIIGFFTILEIQILRKIACSESEAVDYNYKEYFSYKDHELVAPGNEHVHAYDVENTKYHTYFTKRIKEFAKNRFLVLFFDNLPAGDIDKLLKYIEKLINCSTNSKIFKIHAQKCIVSTNFTNKTCQYIFYKFFSKFFQIIKNKLGGSFHHDFKWLTDHTSIESYRGESESILPILDKLLKIDLHTKQIIIDDCCHEDSELKMLYKILQCTFLHLKSFKKYLILSMDNLKLLEQVEFENELIKNLAFRNIEIYYTKSEWKNDELLIKIRTLKTEYINNTYHSFFKDIVEKKGCYMMYRIGLFSLHCIYQINYCKIDRKNPNKSTNTIESLTNNEDLSCYITLYTYTNTIIIKILSNLIENTNKTISICYKIYMQDNLVEKQNNKLVSVFEYLYENVQERYVCYKDKQLYGFNDLFTFINYYKNFDPYFIDISPFIYEIDKNSINIIQNEGKKFRIKITHDELKEKINIIKKNENSRVPYSRIFLKPYDFTLHDTFYHLKKLPFKINYDNKQIIANNIIIKHCDLIKISDLLTDCLILTVSFDVKDTIDVLYVKITLEDTICPRNSSEYDRREELQEDFSKKLKEHFFNSILKEHNDTNITKLEKKTFYIIDQFFVNYTNLDHLLYTTNVYYRKRFVFQKVCECLFRFLQFDMKDLVFERRESKTMKYFLYHTSMNLHSMYINSDIMFDYICNTSQCIRDTEKCYYFASKAFETILRTLKNINVLHLSYAQSLANFIMEIYQQKYDETILTAKTNKRRYTIALFDSNGLLDENFESFYQSFKGNFSNYLDSSL